MSSLSIGGKHSLPWQQLYRSNRECAWCTNAFSVCLSDCVRLLKWNLLPEQTKRISSKLFSAWWNEFELLKAPPAMRVKKIDTESSWHIFHLKEYDGLCNQQRLWHNVDCLKLISILFFKNNQTFVLQWATYSESEWGQYVNVNAVSVTAIGLKQYECKHDFSVEEMLTNLFCIKLYSVLQLCCHDNIAINTKTLKQVYKWFKQLYHSNNTSLTRITVPYKIISFTFLL